MNKMAKWERILIQPTTEIVKAIEVIDHGGLQIALVVDENRKLLGTVTDGDLRRGLLKGIGLKEAVSKIMNPKPTTANTKVSRAEISEIMREKSFRHIPIVNEKGILIRIETIDTLAEVEELPNFVVLMAGGEGKRLFPLTKDTPKPLLKVGSKPILQTILDGFVGQGFKNFLISVNYKAEMVEDFFGDGANFNAKIDYLRETEHLGTAGSLALISNKLENPILVMNGDLLTKVSYKHLLDFHIKHGADATVCVREYDFQVPFGVVTVEGEQIKRIDEKPVHSFFVNGGIYVLNPDILSMIEKNRKFDMTELLDKLMKAGKTVAAFPLREYWLDIGRTADFEKANGEFVKIFE
jgi:dTDP-glucose pyrophosphorylase